MLYKILIETTKLWLHNLLVCHASLMGVHPFILGVSYRPSDDGSQTLRSKRDWNRFSRTSGDLFVFETRVSRSSVCVGHQERVFIWILVDGRVDDFHGLIN